MAEIALTEQRNPATKNIDLMESVQIVEVINQEDKLAAEAVEKVLPQVAKAVDYIAGALKRGGRLAYFGAGTSGRIGILDASECPPTFGVSSETVQAFIAGGDKAVRHSVEQAEDNADFALADLAKFAPTEKDVVVAVSASGNPAYVVTVLKKAREAGAVTVAVSSNPEAAMRVFADVFINPQVGPEAIAGSSRMKSGTAQKMILNMLSTAAMVRIGKTYENLMIDVRVSNQKLRARACRMIEEITGADGKTAEDYLKRSKLDVKAACVMLMKKCGRQKAEKLLAAAGGILRKVIK